MVISPCSEFPNANPDLHDGALFGCADPCGPCGVVHAAPRGVTPGESGSFTSAPHTEELPHVAEIEPFRAGEPIEEIRHDPPTPCLERVTEGEAPGDGFARAVAVLERMLPENGGETIMQEARKNPRRALSLALELDDVVASGPARHGRMGVSRNISMSGLLVNTPSRFVQGSRVSVRVHTHDGKVSKFDAEVARVDECGPRSNEPWRYSVALRFRGLRWLNVGARRKSAALLKLGI